VKKTEKPITILGQGTNWEGKLKFDGSIRIDGHFKGEIFANGMLIVGEEGMIEGDIYVSYLVISGEIHGNIVSDQRVDIHYPGKVFGNIQAPAVVMDQGVIFEGTTQMYRVKETDEEKSGLIEADAYAGGPPPNLTAIHGIVIDQDTGFPIKNVRVTCKNRDKKKTNTNASGYYELVNLGDGDWKLEANVRGYKKEKARVQIANGGTHRQNFELKPKK